MQRHFEIELEQLQSRIVEMGALVQQAIHLSVEVFRGGNPLVSGEEAVSAAKEVIHRIEPRVNELQLQIDKNALDLLALQHVVASDLRFVTTATRIGNDLESMSDRAVNIAHRAIALLASPVPKSVAQIPIMTEAVEATVRDAMDAFARRDESLALQILKREKEIHQYRDQVFHELTSALTSEAQAIQQALDLILISRNIERIADHATSIAENVVFMVRGEDIRHRYNVAGGLQ